MPTSDVPPSPRPPGNPHVPKDEASERHEIVIVGAGLAGLVAGLRAAELGCSVAVLERGTTADYPCNARMAGGIFHIAQTEMRRPPAELAAAAMAATDGTADLGIIEALAAKSSALIDWLLAQGVAFSGGGASWQTWRLAPSRAIAAGMDWKDRGPDRLLHLLGQRLRERGGRLVLGAEAKTLIMRGTRCTGVTATRNGQDCAFHAQAVILADGGFQADPALVARYICPHPDRLKLRGAATGTGTGLLMGLAVGAAVTRLEQFYGHLLSCDAMHTDKVWPYPELDGIAAASLMVGPKGTRFADEGMGGIYLANAVARLPDPLLSWIVCDDAVWEGPGRSARIPANPELVKAGGTIHRADAFAAAAEVAGLPAAALAETVATYNRALLNDTLADLAPPRTTRRHRAFPLEKPPFSIIPVCAGITCTIGGLAVDRDARVLSQSGPVIDGLYAIGTTAAGTDGGPPIGYVGGQAQAGVFGLIAAEHAAAHIQR
jgi:fumarate reductase flavoprotein subunit